LVNGGKGGVATGAAVLKVYKNQSEKKTSSSF